MTGKPLAELDLDVDAIERGRASAEDALAARPGAEQARELLFWALAEAYAGSRERGGEVPAGAASALLVEGLWALGRVVEPPARVAILELSRGALEQAPDEELQPRALVGLVHLGLGPADDMARRAVRIASAREGAASVEALVCASALLPAAEAAPWLDVAIDRASALLPEERSRVAERALLSMPPPHASLLAKKLDASGGSPRELLIAVAPRLPLAERTNIIAGTRARLISGAILAELATARAFVQCLDEGQSLRSLDEAALTIALCLVEHLSGAGAAERALERFDARFAAPVERTEARLVAYGATSQRPDAAAVAFVRRTLAALDDAQWAEVVHRQARGAAALGERKAIEVRLASLNDVRGVEVRAALARFAPKPWRSRLLREAVELQGEVGDESSLVEIVRSAPWLTKRQAAELLLLELSAADLQRLLRQYGALWWTAPLLARVSGDSGLEDVARLLRDALRPAGAAS
jgi:hypothetical protein